MGKLERQRVKFSIQIQVVQGEEDISAAPAEKKARPKRAGKKIERKVELEQTVADAGQFTRSWNRLLGLLDDEGRDIINTMKTEQEEDANENKQSKKSKSKEVSGVQKVPPKNG